MIAQKSSEQGYRPSENRYGHDNDVQVSKRRRTNKLNQDFSQDDNDVKKKKSSSESSC